MKLHETANPLLSVCLPVFNHADRLALQLKSLAEFQGRKSDVEMVFVDDASTDDLSAAVSAFTRSGWKVVFARQDENRGRAAALARAVRLASGRYTLIMDADDTYVAGGLDQLVDELGKLDHAQNAIGEPLQGVVCGVVADAGGNAHRVVPPREIECTLLELRANHSVIGDLKEVVRTELLSEALCPLFDSSRRVPTSLLWARIAQRGRVRCLTFVLCNKFYLPGGMTKSLHTYRRGSIAPLLELYWTIAYSSGYKSWRYRLRAALNYHRFLAWEPKTGLRVMRGALGLIGLAGYAFGFLEIRTAKLHGR